MRLATALALAVLLAPAYAAAAWQPGGNPIGEGAGFAAAASGGRVLVAWSGKGLSGTEIRLQAWTADGDVVSGWPLAGVLVSDASGENYYPAVCEDGSGGAFVAWSNQQGDQRSFHLQHVSASGALAPGWPAQGHNIGMGQYIGPLVIAGDGAGGVLLGWSEYRFDGTSQTSVHIQRFDGGGAPVTGWPVGGLSIPNAYAVGFAVDSERRIFVSTADIGAASQAGARVQRLDDTGAPDPGWPQAGTLLPEIVYPSYLRLYPDGTGGVFVGWVESLVCVGDIGCDLYPATTRLQSDGTPDGGWIPAQRGYSSAPDGTGGVLLGRASAGRPGAVRLSAAGIPMPGWAPEGNPAMTEVVDPIGIGVVDDGAGGAFVTWVDNRTGKGRIYASRLDGTGRLANGWPLTGSFVDADRGGNVYQLQMVSLGGGVAIASWSEWSSQGLLGYLAALRPGEPGPIADLRSVQGQVGFGIVNLRPNPANGPIVATVELPNEGPARIELVDAAGRLLESQTFAFWRQARGAVHFNQSRTLPPGIYWLRLTQGSRRAVKKLVVLH